MSGPAASSPFLRAAFDYCRETRSEGTAQIYTAWMRRYILFHRFRSASEILKGDIRRKIEFFLLQLAASANTQNQALCALLVLYNEILGEHLDQGWQRMKAKRPWRLPEIVSRREVSAIFGQMQGASLLMAQLLYGSGLKVGECVGLRMAQVNIADRLIVLPTHESLLAEQVCEALSRRMHFVRGCYALKGLHDIAQYYVFPEASLFDPDIEIKGYESIHRSVLQKAVQLAVRKVQRQGALLKQISCQGLRDSFAVEMLRQGVSIRQVQDMLGIVDIRQVMRYTRCLPVRHYTCRDGVM